MFQKIVRCGRTAYAVEDLPLDLLIRLVECPELPLRMGPAETIKAGNSALVVRAALPLGGGMASVAYKRVRRKTLLKRLTQAFGPNRTFRTFRAGLRLVAAGVATARPLAVIVPSRWDLAAPSWIVSEWLDGASDLATFSPRASGEASAASAVGELLGRMHAAGWAHRDLKPQNLLVRFGPDGSAQAFVIDLDGVRFVGRVSERIRWKNLSRLFASHAGWLVDPEVQERILRSYLVGSRLSMDCRAAQDTLAQALAARRAA